MVLQTNNMEDAEQFRFNGQIYQLLLSLTGDGNGNRDLVETLALRRNNLAFVSFSDFSNLKRLDLAHNRLTSETLLKSGLNSCKQLQLLDLSHNHIVHRESVWTVVNELPMLMTLRVKGNPCFSYRNEKNRAKMRVAFLSGVVHIRSPDTLFRKLNKEIISIQEKCVALTYAACPQEEVERLRFQMIALRLNLSEDDEEVDMSKFDIHLIRGIHQYTSIHTLCLDGNRMSTLEGQCLESLPNLQRLSVLDNRFTSLNSVVLPLQLCDKLKHIKIGSRFCPELLDPKSFSIKAFTRLRGVQTIDGYSNPHPYTAEQEEAVSYLSKFGAGPNNVVDIDFTDRHIEMQQFWPILMALVELRDDEMELGAETILIRHKNFMRSNPGDYRLLLIHQLPSLVRVDDQVVTEDDRNNALNLWDNHYSKKCPRVEGPNSDRLTIRLVRTSEKGLDQGLRTVGATSAGTGAAAGQATGLAADTGAGTGALDVESRGTTAYDDVEVQHKRLPFIMAFETVLRFNLAILESAGMFLSKLEILINFIQIFSLILVFDIDWEITWPKSWLNITSWLSNLNLSIDAVWPSVEISVEYVKFVVIMTLPLLFLLVYFLKFNRDRWLYSYKAHFVRTLWTYFGIFCLLEFLTIVALLIAETETLRNLVAGKLAITPEFWGYFIIFSAIWASFIMLLILVICIFRCKSNDKVFWANNFSRLRKRICLFVITISYLPIARTIMVAFKCDRDSVDLLVYSGVPCPYTRGGFPAIWIVSIFFIFLYVIGIPLFFVVLIRKGIPSVLAAADLETDDKIIARLEEHLKKLKEEKKKKNPKVTEERIKKYTDKIKERKKISSQKYAMKVRNWRSPSSYLYSAYTRKQRYFKLVQLLEKLLLLVITLYLLTLGSVQEILGTAVVGIFLGLTVIFQPFSDFMEDLMDIVARAANSLNAGILTMLKFNVDFPAAICLFAVNGAAVSFILFNFVSYPIRSCLNNRKRAKMLSDEANMEDLGEQEVRSDSVAWEVDDQYSDIEEMEVEGAGAGAGVDADADAEDVEAPPPVEQPDNDEIVDPDNIQLENMEAEAHQEIPAPSDDDQSVMAAEGSGAEVPGGVEEMPPEENSEVRAVSASEVGSVATAAAAGGVAGLTAGGVASLAYTANKVRTDGMDAEKLAKEGEKAQYENRESTVDVASIPEEARSYLNTPQPPPLPPPPPPSFVASQDTSGTFTGRGSSAAAAAMAASASFGPAGQSVSSPMRTGSKFSRNASRFSHKPSPTSDGNRSRSSMLPERSSHRESTATPTIDELERRFQLLESFSTDSGSQKK